MRIPSVVLAVLLMLGCGGSQPEASASTSIVVARPSDQGALARLAGRWPDQSARTCAIVWSSPGTSWLYDGTMTLLRTGVHVVGSIEWRLVTADAAMPELVARQGDTAAEQIEGAFDTTIGAFVLHTTWLGDPTLNGAAMYRLELTDDGFRGATAGDEDGVWDGEIRCGGATPSPSGRQP